MLAALQEVIMVQDIKVEAERRKEQRHRTLKSGSIAFNGAARIDCRVRNLSPIGACLEVTSPLGIPEQFVLVIETDHFRQPCHVIWRSPTRLGVEFGNIVHAGRSESHKADAA